ncbi:aminotransferase V [Halobacillus andaensis]|uniref:Aminotransferase V n=1 Tax=Halobacillus andaensis TaxID=1176239 RepID=A0A917AY80_HALAA|nr:cysteine desulfurase family protein [Halobacillus andaensis]MBP2002834.1 cysteine desulfurase [Halobacillus andaensis]GGF06050.1 aminotransferase V [Halobacillus andaensis]
MIYFDNSATTRPFPEVIDVFQKVAHQYFANPSSPHYLGAEAERLLEHTRKKIAEQLKVQPNEVIFTSGGTEGNNLAIKGIALEHQGRGKHMITSQIEHPSVIEAFKGLERLGFEVTYVNVDRYGYVDPEAIEKEIREDTILISTMSVNNELGTIQPIEEIAKMAKRYPKLYLHVDHVQGVGKVPLSLKQIPIDLLTVSGHKIHGLNGTGVLFVRGGIKLFPLFHGGGHENNRRSGTENAAGMVAFGKAMRLIAEKERDHVNELKGIREELISQLDQMNDVVINSPQEGAPHILNISVPGVKPEVMVHALAEKEIFISTKSACSSKQPDVSSVLQACHLAEDVTTSALRISLSYQNDRSEVEPFMTSFKQTVHYLKGKGEK